MEYYLGIKMNYVVHRKMDGTGDHHEEDMLKTDMKTSGTEQKTQI
jgi:hypothetical protein